MEQEIRPLTREEQLEWYIPFLEGEIEKYIQELERAKAELASINKDNKVLKLTK